MEQKEKGRYTFNTNGFMMTVWRITEVEKRSVENHIFNLYFEDGMFTDKFWNHFCTALDQYEDIDIGGVYECLMAATRSYKKPKKMQEEIQKRVCKLI